MDEIDGSIEDFPTLADFFTRKLKAGLRPLCTDPDAIVSPSDSLIASCGKVENGVIPQGGKLKIDIAELLGQPKHTFEGGNYIVLYLSPPDYHRVHVPCEATLKNWSYFPGRLFPVFAACAEKVEGVFAKNERVTCWLDTKAGTVAEVMVGAFGVGRISTTFSDLITNTSGKAKAGIDNKSYKNGDELGVFHLGSTVILLFEPNKIELECEAGQKVRVNQRIAKCTT